MEEHPLVTLVDLSLLMPPMCFSLVLTCIHITPPVPAAPSTVNPTAPGLDVCTHSILELPLTS